MTEPLLDVQDLQVSFATEDGLVRAAVQGKRDPVHGAHETVFGRERDLQILHVQQRLSHQQSSPRAPRPLA